MHKAVPLGFLILHSNKRKQKTYPGDAKTIFIFFYSSYLHNDTILMCTELDFLNQIFSRTK